jgi:hypothetical protein
MNPFINNTNITQIHVVASVSMLINASGTIIYHDQEYFNQFIHHGVICTIMVIRDHLSVVSVELYWRNARTLDLHAQRTGRPRSLNSRDEIGLILFYFGSSMSLSEMLFLSLKYCMILVSLKYVLIKDSQDSVSIEQIFRYHIKKSTS